MNYGTYKTDSRPPFTLVVYHAQCRDGQAAAAVAHSVLGSSVDYVAAQHNQPLPPLADKPGQSILFLDFAPTREQLDGSDWRSWYVIDHHKSNLWIKDRYPENVFFDLNRSGAVLAWNWFYPQQIEVPKLLQYVEDRDLWIWQLPNSRELSCLIKTFPSDFLCWHSKIWKGDKWPSRKDIAHANLLYTAERQVYCAAAVKADLYEIDASTNLPKLRVRMTNATTFISDTCNEILARRDDVDVACCYFLLNPDRVVVSFRSRQGFDLLPYVQAMGGGGHPRACGTAMSFSEFTGRLNKL